MTDALQTLLPRLGLLAIDGPDAATFLQGQATCDTRLLSPARGALGALCNLQGRMIVSFYVLPVDGGLRLVLPADRVATVLAHLKKYAVFSKVALADGGSAHEVTGGTTTPGDEPFTIDDAGRMTLRGGRTLALVPAGSMAVDAALATGWQAAAITAGELLVDTANADRFLPQALNYDVLDGVSFKKGCYTGQEVVARMHFKGRMKERLYVATADTADAPAANTPVVDANGKTVGEVVDALVHDGRCLVGAVVRHEAVAAGGLRAGDAQGPLLGIGVQPVVFPA